AVQSVMQMDRPPVPIESELERAILSMRARFVSGCEEIAAQLAALESCLVEVPPNERKALLAAAAQIRATQEQLKACMHRLPLPAWDRFKTIVSVLKAQQAPLEQVGLLVKEHVLPRQLHNLSLANAEREQRERAIAVRRARAMQAEASTSAQYDWPDGED